MTFLFMLLCSKNEPSYFSKNLYYEKFILCSVHFSAFKGKVIYVKTGRKKVRYLVENMNSLRVWISIIVVPQSHRYSCKRLVWFELWCLTPFSTICQLYRVLSVLLVKKSGVPRENHRPVTNHWQTLSLLLSLNLIYRTIV
jgi:hypothetical protein